MALIATPLLMGHKFMALVNPETRIGLSGMFTGFVDRQWAQQPGAVEREKQMPLEIQELRVVLWWRIGIDHRARS